jgi:hypothetical protein
VLHLRDKLALAFAAALALAGVARAQTAFGLTGTGDLFSFDLATPGARTVVGNLGVTVQAMAARPGGGEIYAVSIGATNGELYHVDTATAAATLLGSFALSGNAGGNGYDLSGATAFGLAADPRSLQGDGGFRLTLVADNGDALALNSNDGMVVAELPDLTGAGGVQLAALAYSLNTTLTVFAGTPAPLFGVDYLADQLVSVDLATGNAAAIGAGLGHDLGTGLTGDISINGSGQATFYVFDTSGGAANFYAIDLGTGAASLVGTVAGGDFSGGFAIMAVPEPAHWALLAAFAAVGAALWRRRGVAPG